MKEFLSSINISEGIFENKSNLSTGYVSGIKTGIGSSTIAKINKSYPSLNTNWLLTGEGDMIVPNNTAERKMIQQPTDGYIPVYDVTFTLGFTPTFIDSRDNHDVLGYVNFPELVGSTYVVRAKGNSMAPLINDKDFVGIRPVKNKNNIDYGNPYGVITEDLAVFKRLRTSTNENKIRLVSDNPDHDEYEILKEEVIHLFSVIGILSVKSIAY